MINIDDEDKLVEKLGGKFKLTILIQKRMLELLQGAHPLIEVEMEESNPLSGPPKRQDLMKVIVREILEDKISLEPADELKRSLLESPSQKTDTSSKKSSVKEFFGDEIKKMKKERLEEYTTLLKTKE